MKNYDPMALATRLDQITNEAKAIESKLVDALMSPTEKKELETLIKTSNEYDNNK